MTCILRFQDFSHKLALVPIVYKYQTDSCTNLVKNFSFYRYSYLEEVFDLSQISHG